ncbi:MmcQ/YjbR family DNA-binding protein [Streptomyces sp. SLBN-8D4]|uniref:MmcQ/YjbR family DNA-binding protein n=1 Tax=Streptomyces sp. SLBN-8D4 TaxID=3377728 RepID=UPI003C7B5623
MSAAGDRLQDTARQAALALPDVSHGYPFAPGLDVYKVAGKVFLIVTDDPDEQIITVKCEPEHARASAGRPAHCPAARASSPRRPREP